MIKSTPTPLDRLSDVDGRNVAVGQTSLLESSAHALGHPIMTFIKFLVQSNQCYAIPNTRGLAVCRVPRTPVNGLDCLLPPCGFQLAVSRRHTVQPSRLSYAASLGIIGRGVWRLGWLYSLDLSRLKSLPRLRYRSAVSLLRLCCGVTMSAHSLCNCAICQRSCEVT